MKHLAGLGAVAMLATLTACETTGNPSEGGLFGWSENKARQRQAQKQSSVTGAEVTLQRVDAGIDSMETRHTAANKNLSAAQARQAREEKHLHALRDSLVARTEKLEADSLTDAAASRARAYRLKVSTIAENRLLSPQQRMDRLSRVEVEIDKALEKLRR